MDIVVQLIEKYCEQNNTPITISFDIDENVTDILITRGRYEQNGSRREYLSFQDIKQILEVNNIVGENSLVREELDFLETELSTGKGNRFNRLQNVESLIYDTLAKYIIQLLDGAPIAKLLYPEIIPLPKHKDMFFRDI